MKKLLISLLTLLCLSVHAKENIVIFYAWGPGDSVANYHRTIANEANKLQDKYNFIFDTKPGAGGAIATNHVLNTSNSILAHSTAFFVRPVVFPNESYDLTKYKEQYVHCMAPMAITSTKYKSWKDVASDAKVSVGISGLGVTTHLAALEMQKRFTNLNIIPFRSTNDSMLSMISGQTDFHIGFISEAEQWSKDNSSNEKKVIVLGITGTKIINGYTPLATQGFNSSFADMNVGHHLLVPITVDDNKRKEIYDIFSRAAKTESVKSAYMVDYCEPQSISYDGLTKFFEFHTQYWKKLASQVKLDSKM
jgi:tripartite-type tricarboxylate transporter receptor subunit TctC